MSGSNLVVKISAADKFSKAFGALGKSLSGAGNAVGGFAKSSGTNLARMSKAVTHLGGSAAKAGVHMTEALAPLGILTGALSAAGFGKMVSDWARFSQSLSFNATRIGIGVSQLQALEGSAQLAGSSASAAAGGLQNLQDTMVDTVGGRNMEALVYFRQLGVAFDDGRGHALRAAAVLPKLADAIARIPDPSIQARVATQFFGGATESLLPWLRKGSAGIKEYADLAKQYGVETEDSTDKAGVFRFAQERLTLAFLGLGRSISSGVSPPLSEMMTFLADLVNKWRPAISATFTEWAKNAGVWVKSIDWPATIGYIEGLGTKFKNLMDSISSYTPPAWLQWVLRRFGSDTPAGATGGKPTAGGGVNGPLSDDNPNAPGSPAFYKAHPEIKPPGDRSFFHPSTLPPFWGGSGAKPVTIDSTMRGFLDTLAGPESQGQYDIKNGWTPKNDNSKTRFSDYSHFPEGVAPGGTSTASGRYQFISKTWHDEADKLGLKDFGPDNQDQAAWHLANTTYRSKTGRDLDDDLKAGNRHPQIATALGPIWPSLPGGSQSNQSQDTFNRSLAENTAKVEVHVRFSGAPSGTTATATSNGAPVGSVRVEHSMAPT